MTVIEPNILYNIEKENENLKKAYFQLLEDYAKLTAENQDLTENLHRFARMPSLDWARACAVFMQQAAKLHRSGVNMQPFVETFDKLKSYVVRLEARNEKLEKEKAK